jgi:hypothetical protein
MIFLGGDMKGAKKTLFVVLILVLALGMVTPALAQNQLNLNDGIVNSFFFGGGSNHISLTMPGPPFPNCSGGTCNLAIATANGTGDLSSSGNYSISAPATIPVQGGFAGPFSLTVQADGSSAVNQTAPITFTYSSPQGTLTGLMTFTTVSPTVGFTSTMAGAFTATGGTFAQFFPFGGTVSLTLGVTGLPLQKFPTVPHAFSPMEIQGGTIVADTGVCGQTLPLRLKRYEEGLPRFVPHSLNDLLVSFTQSNSPGLIPCSTLNPCGSLDVALGSGSFTGDLVVTVQLSGAGADFQIDRMGFNSDVNNGFFLSCFNFGTGCSSGVGGASLGGSQQEDGFGTFANTLFTGLNGGSGCAEDGTGCQTTFTAVIGNSNGSLGLSDFNSFVAAHVANGTCTGYIATPNVMR